MKSKNVIRRAITTICTISVAGSLLVANGIIVNADDTDVNKTIEEIAEEIAEETYENAKEKSSVWEKETKEDKYGRPTDDVMYYAEAQGTFSNSSETNGDLTVYIIPQQDASVFVDLMLIEYGRFVVSNPYDEDLEYDVYVLDSNEEEHKLNGVIAPNSNAMTLYDDGIDREHTSFPLLTKEAEKILLEGGIVFFSIESKDSMDKYVFSFDCSGLREEVPNEYLKYVEEE